MENTVDTVVNEKEITTANTETIVVCDTEETTQPTIDLKDDLREVVPDIKGLTIKNLDTGEEFIIGENDPDFEFNTFEIRGSYERRVAENNANDTVAANEGIAPNGQQEHVKGAWWVSLLNYLYGSTSSKKKTEAQNKMENELLQAQSMANKPKTPFTKLSSFKFRKELGRGAFGRVLLAEAKTDGKLYALKIISKKNMRSSDKRQAKAERDILHSMTLKSPHPFTSGLKFAFQSENNLYLGMDYIPGGNLRELIKKFKCLPESWVQVYGAQLVLAISHLHSLNVLYRDIKPHNVMIDARGHLVLIDFGLSKQEISHPRGALSLVGTPDYSAPEVLKTGVQQIEANNREKMNSRKKKIPKSSQNSKLPMIGYGKAADWWSLGIMIYEMLSGVPTFRGSDLRQTYQRILYADLEFVPEERFSPAARNLLSGLIKRDPSLRLGAWENPPQDIMSSPFFAGIGWDAIYERVQDGPWIPEVPVFGHSKKTSAKSGKEATTGSEAEDAEGRGHKGGEKDEYADFDTFKPTMHPAAAKSERNKLKQQNGADKRSVSAADPSGEHHHDGDNEMGESSGSSSDESGEESEEDGDYLSSNNMRDSVFILSRGQLENKLADWSFMDEQVLQSTLAAGNDEAAQEEKRRKREERRAARKLRQEHIATVPEDDEEAGAESERSVTGSSHPASTQATEDLTPCCGDSPAAESVAEATAAEPVTELESADIVAISVESPEPSSSAESEAPPSTA